MGGLKAGYAQGPQYLTANVVSTFIPTRPVAFVIHRYRTERKS